MSAPVPFPFLWTLGLGFGTWIWDLDLGLDLGLTIKVIILSIAKKGDKGGRHSCKFRVREKSLIKSQERNDAITHCVLAIRDYCRPELRMEG